MKCFKKAIVSCALVTTLLAPTARASVGMAFGGPAAIVVGAACMTVSVGGAYGGYRLIKKGKTALGIGAIVLSAAVGLWGFALLDGEQQGQFAEISPEYSGELGLSSKEVSIYNSEVEQVNAIARQISEELNGSDNVELARDMWIELGTQLSPETMKTVVAIAQQSL